MHPRSKAQEHWDRADECRQRADIVCGEPTNNTATARAAASDEVKDLRRELLFGGSCSTKTVRRYVRDLGLKCS
jgi:glycerol dehydrogenase-like iron-containing ADH family enzyme